MWLLRLAIVVLLIVIVLGIFSALRSRRQRDETASFAPGERVTMSEEDFWELIGTVSCDESGELDVSALQTALEARTPMEIIAFAEVFDRLHASSFGWDLWGAAYVLNGGCSDDGFDYFRAWLIGRGRQAFEAVTTEPDRLVDFASEGVECEELLYVASQAFEAVTGSADMPFSRTPLPELGEDWDFDDPELMRARYPKLWTKFGE